MNVQKILRDSATCINSLSQRLSVQAAATHDPSDKADLKEWIEDCQNLRIALSVINTAYAPAIQNSIDTGVVGVSHSVIVALHTSLDVSDPIDPDSVISIHVFEVENLKAN